MKSLNLTQHYLNDNIRTDNVESEVLCIDENVEKILRYEYKLLKKAENEFYPRSYQRAIERFGEY